MKPIIICADKILFFYLISKWRCWCLQIFRIQSNEAEAKWTEDIYKYIFFNENIWIPNKISLKFFPNGHIKIFQYWIRLWLGVVQAIIWTNHGQFTDAYMRHLALMCWIYVDMSILFHSFKMIGSSSKFIALVLSGLRAWIKWYNYIYEAFPLSKCCLTSPWHHSVARNCVNYAPGARIERRPLQPKGLWRNNTLRNDILPHV